MHTCSPMWVDVCVRYVGAWWWVVGESEGQQRPHLQIRGPGLCGPTTVYHRQHPPSTISHPDVQPGSFSSRRGSGNPPWHVHTGCCPGGENTQKNPSRGASQRTGSHWRAVQLCVRREGGREREKETSWGSQRYVTFIELNWYFNQASTKTLKILQIK